MLALFTLFIYSLFAPALETQFNGFVSAEGQYYFEDLADPTRQYDVILSAQPELDLKYNRMSRMHFKPLLRGNVATDEKAEQAYLNVQEAFWEIKAHPWRGLIGMNTYNWGILDGYSTQDIVNGRFMYNPLSSDKRGAPTVDLKYEGDGIQVQALYIPAQSRTLLPSTDSRWLPRDVSINTHGTLDDQTVTLLLPDTFDYYIAGKREFDNALSNNYGLRLTSRVNDLDLAAMYFEGASTMPQFNIVANTIAVTLDPLVLQATSDVGLIPIYYRQRAMGVSAVWAPSDIIFKMESTYIDTISDDPLLSPWSWQNGVGIEMPWNIGSTTMTTILQVYYGKNERAPDNLVSSTGRLFDRAALVAARWSLSSDSNLLASFLYDYDGGAHYTRVAYDIKLSDALKAEISADLIEGDPDTFLGTYTKNDRASLKLSYLW